MLRGTASVVLRSSGESGSAVAIAGDLGEGRRGRTIALEEFGSIQRGIPSVRVPADRVEALADLFRPALQPRELLLVPLGQAQEARHLLLCAAPDLGALDGPVEELAVAFAGAVAGALAQLRSAEDHARRTERQSALTRAAKTLNESLDLSTLLTRICQEATSVLGADSAAIYSCRANEGLTIQAICGLPPEALTYRLPCGAGLAGKVMLADRPMLAEDFQAIAQLPPTRRSPGSSPAPRRRFISAGSCRA